MNIDKDSVVNFLTPTKLVHGSLKTKPRVHLHESQQSSASKRAKPEQTGDIPPYSFTAHFDKLNRDIDRSREKTEQAGGQESREHSRPPSDRNTILNTSKTMLKSEDNYRPYPEEKYEEKPIEAQKDVFNLHPVEYVGQPSPTEELLSKVKFSANNSRVDELSRV
jgi:hypothetical protein